MQGKEAWIALDLMGTIGPRSILKLLEVYGKPESILAAPTRELRELGILKKTQLASLAAGPDEKRVSGILESLRTLNAHAVCLDDALYPRLLKDLTDPPVVLYCMGSLESIEPAIAVVGTRAPSHTGREHAYTLSRDLSMKGVCIVSGLARGIDTQAHTGALEGIGSTVAVLGSGLDVLYPPENTSLAERIAQRGAVITEFPPGTSPDAKNFPRRNRILSGLSVGTVVIEATLRSGALITARMASEYGRLVMALPGSITNVRTQGPHLLIRQGATLIQNADEVMEEIAPQVKSLIRSSAALPDHHDDIVDLLVADPLSIEEIAQVLNKDIPEITSRVSRLELAGAITKGEGNRFSVRREHA
ncbi:MAG TPA: DNA-protecting protein DprA [Deltaproteobacteria bacterium]|nr:DNA-protecting protein DprA [Deltaproteobacteria bacterium]